MKFFIDTADLDEIKQASDWGILAGVTTNPSLYAKTGGKLADFEDHMVKICKLCKGLLGCLSYAHKAVGPSLRVRADGV